MRKEDVPPRQKGTSVLLQIRESTHRLAMTHSAAPGFQSFAGGVPQPILST